MGIRLAFTEPDFRGYYRGKDTYITDYVVQALRPQDINQMTPGGYRDKWFTVLQTTNAREVQNITGLEQHTNYRLRVAARNPTGLGNYSNITDWFQTGVVGNINVSSHNNASVTAPGVHLDTPFQLRVTLTGENNKTTVGDTTITLSTSSDDGDCQFSASRLGTYEDTLSVPFVDKQMLSTDAWIKCASTVGSSGGPYVQADETYFRSHNEYKSFATKDRLIVYDEPDPPSSLLIRDAASDGNPTTITLSWDEPSDNNNAITRYLVRRTDVEEGTTVDLTTTDTYYVHTGLDQYSNYDFVVYAVNQAGRGEVSDTISFKTGVTGKIDIQMYDGAPLYPAPGFEVHTFYHLRVVLNVTEPGTKPVGNTDVQIYLTNDGHGSNCMFANSRSPNYRTTINVTLTDDVAVSGESGSDDLWMRCFNATTHANDDANDAYMMASQFSPVNVFEPFISNHPVLAYDEPTAPTGVAGVSPAALVQSANVTWVRPSADMESEIDMYQVLWVNVADETETHSQNVTAKDGLRTHAVITGLRNGQAYSFRVRARNAAGFGRYSSPSDDVFIVPGEFDIPPLVVLGSDMAGATTTFELRIVPTTAIPNDGACP